MSTAMHSLLLTGAPPRHQLPPLPACRVLHAWALLCVGYFLPLLLLGVNEEASRCQASVCGVGGLGGT